MNAGNRPPEPSFIPWSFAALTPEEAQLEDSAAVVVPVPYDATTSFRGGAREGPRAIIEASRYLEDYDIELNREVHRVGIYTMPEVKPHLGSPEAMVERVREVVDPLAQSGKLLALLGGEHSISVGAVAAFRKMYPDLSVLYLDAHGDLRSEYTGTRFSHGCTARRIWEMCPLVEVGVRSLSQEEMCFIREKGIKVYFQHEGSFAVPWSVDEVMKTLSPRVYVSIDLDVFDPSVMPAVGTPEPGGLSWEVLLRLMKAVCKDRSVVGFDLTELCPGVGPPSCAFIAAKLAYKIIGYATEGRFRD